MGSWLLESLCLDYEVGVFDTDRSKLKYFFNSRKFLYYEEIDWFTRAAGRFALLIAADAHLYHREGASIGSRSWRRGPSLLSDRHMFRSRRQFMQRYYPRNQWRCALGNWLDVGKRLLRGQWRNAAVIAGVLLARPPVATVQP